MMRWKDLLCVVCLFGVSTVTIEVLLAATGPCTGHPDPCGISPTPPPGPAGATCCRPSGSPSPAQYTTSGSGTKLYVEHATNQCGNTAEVRQMGGSLACIMIISNNTCGGKQAVISCTPTP